MKSLAKKHHRAAFATLLLSMALPAARGALIVANSGDQVIDEGAPTTVTFAVINTFPFPVMLDYAAAIITVGPVDPDDWVHFANLVTVHPTPVP